MRTVISLDDDDKRWLDSEAARQGVPMTEIIRRAVRRMRSEQAAAQAFERLLKETRGIGSGEDGLARQKRLRREWRRRPA